LMGLFIVLLLWLARQASALPIWRSCLPAVPPA
jgi:hypothetical protein